MIKWIFIVIFLLSIMVSSFSQVLLKKSSQKKYENLIKEYLNPYVISAYCLFFLSTIISVFCYKVLPLSIGPVLETTGYIYITILGGIFFAEKASFKKLLAIFLIFIGVFISTYFG